MSTATVKMPKTKEFNTTDIPVEQMGDISADVEQPLQRPESDSHIELLRGVPVTHDYLDELAFMEEPVGVLFHPPTEKFGAMFVDCFSNGRGIEVLMADGQWLEWKQVPVNEVVVIKRKFVEIFARAKETSIQADYTQTPNENPINNIRRFSSLKHPFSVTSDTPKGHTWLRGVLAGK